MEYACAYSCCDKTVQYYCDCSSNRILLCKDHISDHISATGGCAVIKIVLNPDFPEYYKILSSFQARIDSFEQAEQKINLTASSLMEFITRQACIRTSYIHETIHELKLSMAKLNKGLISENEYLEIIKIYKTRVNFNLEKSSEDSKCLIKNHFNSIFTLKERSSEDIILDFPLAPRNAIDEPKEFQRSHDIAVMLIGECGVGKTSLINLIARNFCEVNATDEFSPREVENIDPACYDKNIILPPLKTSTVNALGCKCYIFQNNKISRKSILAIDTPGMLIEDISAATANILTAIKKIGKIDYLVSVSKFTCPTPEIIYQESQKIYRELSRNTNLKVFRINTFKCDSSDQIVCQNDRIPIEYTLNINNLQSNLGDKNYRKKEKYAIIMNKANRKIKPLIEKFIP